jgi:hypothetical protein
MPAKKERCSRAILQAPSTLCRHIVKRSCGAGCLASSVFEQHCNSAVSNPTLSPAVTCNSTISNTAAPRDFSVPYAGHETTPKLTDLVTHAPECLLSIRGRGWICVLAIGGRSGSFPSWRHGEERVAHQRLAKRVADEGGEDGAEADDRAVRRRWTQGESA